MTLNAHGFVRELASFFSVAGSEKDKAERFDKYATLIAERVSEIKGKYNYEQLLKYFELSRDKFPTIRDILDNIALGIEKSFSGEEGNVIKRLVNGHEYEFVIVPNHWDGVMTINELDKSIARRGGKNENTGTESF